MAPKSTSPPSTDGDVILAIDPGGTTGIAVKFGNNSYMTTVAHSPEELWSFFLGPNKPDVVVFEIFATQGRVDRFMIYTIELVGGIKTACHVLGISGYAHVPQKRLAFMAQAQALLKGKPHVVHEVDALAHLLAYEYRRDNGLLGKRGLPDGKR